MTVRIPCLTISALLKQKATEESDIKHALRAVSVLDTTGNATC